MRKLEKQQVLRVNAPGFGMSASFSVGSAQPLTDYRVILVNPTSVLHLFDKDPEILKQIDAACEQGMGSFPAKSDNLLRSIEPDLKHRYEELRKFLHQGGLLIYFLCPPFFVKGPTVSLDNYVWLMDLAPDKPVERGSRHMSSVSRGKHMELTPRAESSAFARHLKQAGLEWTTLVRAENLTDGYEILSMAGPSKCVAGRLNVGHGQAVFLPGPYSPEYDEKLSECIKLWCASRNNWPIAEEVPFSQNIVETFMSGGTAQPAGNIDLSSQPNDNGAANVSHVGQEVQSSANAQQQAASVENNPVESNSGSAANNQLHNYYNSPASHEEPGTSAQPNIAQNPAANHAEAKAEQQESTAEAPRMEPQAEPTTNTEAPQTFIKKIETISRAVIPDWLKAYSLPELDDWSLQLDQMSEQLRQTSLKIAELSGRIGDMQNLKNALLFADAGELSTAVRRSFEKLGWQVAHESIESEDAHARLEMWLNFDKKTEAIVHVMRMDGQPQRSSLARLAERLISFWDEHESESEPKGIIVANTWADTPLAERSGEDYPQSLIEFAAKKNLCLMTTGQLLGLYRNLELGREEGKDARQKVLSTSGLLQGYDLPGPSVKPAHNSILNAAVTAALNSAGTAAE